MSNHDSTVGQVVSDAAVYIYCFNRKGVNVFCWLFEWIVDDQ